MDHTEKTTNSSWIKIQNGVRETERMLGQKKYNMAMVKARQTLEYMVKCLCERSGILDGGLIDMIDALYEEQIINKTTYEHYHKIRMIGNKAIHEEDNNAYNANQAYHLLSQEVYTFANDYNERKKHPAARSQGSRGTSSQASRTQAASRRPRQSGAKSRRRNQPSGLSLDPSIIIKVLIPVLLIVLLIVVIKTCAPKKEESETTAPTTVETTEAPTETTTEPPTTEPPTTEAPTKYKTNDTVNVRSGPSTSSSKLGLLAPGTEVEYIREETNEAGQLWAVIRYNGNEAYVSKQYITPVTE